MICPEVSGISTGSPDRLSKSITPTGFPRSRGGRVARARDGCTPVHNASARVFLAGGNGPKAGANGGRRPPGNVRPMAAARFRTTPAGCQCRVGTGARAAMSARPQCPPGNVGPQCAPGRGCQWSSEKAFWGDMPPWSSSKFTRARLEEEEGIQEGLFRVWRQFWK